ncbi:SET domain-containing protein [Pyrenochaeta sp. DS3sAY3a]|nr:SET domain-containing protein [Pyrenochaeta sp. DS3sAY3a]
MASLTTLSTILLLTTIHSTTATVGVLDIDDLLQPNLGQQLYASSTDDPLPYAPWSYKPHCSTSKSLATLGQKFCVYTSNTTGPHGLSLIFSPAAARHATQYLSDNPLDSFLTPAEAETLYLSEGGQPWKVVDIPGKDKGVVATRKIKQYETFMVDQAAVVLSTEVEPALGNSETKRLLRVAVERLLVPGMIRDMKEEEGTLEEDIIKTNAFGATVADVGTHTLYPLISRINHACNPNSFVLFSRAGVSMAIKAYRDIEVGEEISISYLLLGIPHKQRQNLISRWGFKCTCSLCSLPDRERQASDLRRTMIAQGEEKIVQLADAYKLSEAITLAEEIVALILEEDIHPLLSDSYAMLAMLWLEKGDREKAEMYGEMTKRLLGDLGFLGVGEEREAWSLETLLGNMGAMGGEGKPWRKAPLRG